MSKILLPIFISFAMLSCSKKLCTRETLLAKFNMKNAALINENTQILNDLTHPQLNFVHSNGWYEDKKSFLLLSKEKPLKYKSITIDSLKSIIVEDTGILSGLGNFDINYKGNDVNIYLYFTETYVCTSNGWQLLSRHSSKKP